MDRTPSRARPWLNGTGLLLRADASTRIGTGHAMRSFALAKAWNLAGGEASLAMAEITDGLAERFHEDGVAVHRLDSRPGTDDDAMETADIARRSGSRCLTVDGYQFSSGYMRRVRSARLTQLMFDDDGCFEDYCADLVLNQNLSASEHLYARREPYTRLLLGTDYALLRPEFLMESHAATTPETASHVLVCMGGTDPENVTERVISALGNVESDIKVTVVVGSGNPNYERLVQLAAEYPGLTLVRNPANMAKLMSTADLAISGAGSTCWELAYMGVPMILIVLAANQQPIATALAERGIALNLGWHANVRSSEIARTVDELWGDHRRRDAMTRGGKLLVDGQGAARVVEVLKALS